MPIRKVVLNEFSPFEQGTIGGFPSTECGKERAEIHLVTGVNGAGKTRFLSFLESAFGADIDLENRGIKRSRDLGKIYFQNSEKSYYWVDGAVFSQGGSQLGYLNDPRFGGFGLSFRGSLRIDDKQIYSQAPIGFGEKRDHLSLDYRPENESQTIAQAIANIVSMGSQEIAQEIDDQKYAGLLRQVNETLAEVIGTKTAFFVDSSGEKIGLRVLIDGERVPMSHLPDGLRSIIAWLFATIAKLEIAFPKDAKPHHYPFTMFLDEPETHLHPAWQRHVLRIAQRLFPNAQIFVATHSPFIISSINHGWIHILKKNSQGAVEFQEPIPCSEGDTYMDVVEDVLGISERYDPETECLLAEFKALKQEVFSNGFTKEPELKELMLKIGGRSESLQHMMGREMYQLNRAMASTRVNP